MKTTSPLVGAVKVNVLANFYEMALTQKSSLVHLWKYPYIIDRELHNYSIFVIPDLEVLDLQRKS
ncbi:MAG: hypothetical protein HYX35_03755 [Proteobacteria bacterium]|nr:hypothetical protein [Pseudomonadota bacterium]